MPCYGLSQGIWKLIKKRRIMERMFLSIAHDEHMKYHRMLKEMVEDELNDFTDEQINSYISFFHKLSDKMEGFEDLI